MIYSKHRLLNIKNPLTYQFNIESKKMRRKKNILFADLTIKKVFIKINFQKCGWAMSVNMAAGPVLPLIKICSF